MMAVDFLLSSSSLKAGLVGGWGGGGVAAVSRFTVHTQNTYKFNPRNPNLGLYVNKQRYTAFFPVVDLFYLFMQL